MFLFFFVLNSVLFQSLCVWVLFQNVAVLVSALLVKSDVKGYTIKHYADNTWQMLQLSSSMRVHAARQLQVIQVNIPSTKYLYKVLIDIKIIDDLKS